MALIHDAYTFATDPFSAEVAPLLGTASPTHLRDRALATYDENPSVRALALRYGGWDREALAAEPDDDAAFWLTLLLYSHLRSDASLGLGSDWRMLQDQRDALGLSAPNARLLVSGRSFAELDVTGSDILRDLRPPSTAGTAGWISRDDALSCLSELDGIGGRESLRRTLTRMLAAAPLCVIISG